MGTGYVTQVLGIVLAAAGNGVGRAVALKQVGGGTIISPGVWETVKLVYRSPQKIPVVGNVVYRPINPD